MSPSFQEKKKSTFLEEEAYNSIVKNRVKFVCMFRNEELKISICLFD